MKTYRMEFSGCLLKRGFWLYIWDIKDEGRRHLYVGRTGDNSSPHASSPFRRIGQHLDSKLNAKANALHRRLRAASIDPERCTFEMLAIGPLFDEQSSMADHLPVRDKMAALERALARELRDRGYHVIGQHQSGEDPDPSLMQQLVQLINAEFPEPKRKQAMHFKPIPLRADGVSMSEFIIREREERF